MRILFILLLCLTSQIQIVEANNIYDDKNNPKSLVTTDDPNVLYKRKLYNEALNKFLPLLKNDKENIELNYKVGMCYLIGSIDYLKAIPFLKKAAESGKSESNAYHMLGKAFQNALMLDNASKAYAKSVEILRDRTDNESKLYLKQSLKEIENCDYARIAIASPIEVTFENLGKDVNSAFADMDPYITPNKTELVFSSNRAAGNQCEKPRKQGYTFDAYMSTYKSGKWGKAANIGPSVNTPLNERVSSISSDGSTMFLYIDNEESTKDGDIYVAKSSGKSFTTPISLKGLVNSGSEESNASISIDGTKLYFASDRDGGAGEKDIYVAKKLPNGDWGEPKRLSNKVNTYYNEDYPVILPDDKTLYFCSEGHKCIGGYDIFKCQWVDSLNDWSEPENLGYPVNTPLDNFSVSITDKMHEGYISAVRPEGLGDYDIYKVVFTDAESAPYSIVRGKINNGDSEGITTNVIVKVTNKKSNKLVGKYNISAKKKGNFFGILHPGEYSFEIINEQSKPHTIDFVIVDKNLRGDIINKDFIIPSLKEPLPKPTENGKTKKSDKKVKK